jgi:HEAT repeat protein
MKRSIAAKLIRDEPTTNRFATMGLHKGSHVEQLPDARKCELLLDARRDPVKRVRARAAKALARLAEYD